MRYTKQELQGMFGRLVRAMNKKVEGVSYDGLGLDYAACYGGYVIVQYGARGSESHPFGCMRRTAKEMYLSMYMTAQALENIKYEQELLSRKAV